MSETGCELCGLPLRYAKITQTIYHREVHFCCQGCRIVYAMLLESVEGSDPARFKESELYRKCVTAGVIPADEADLRRLQEIEKTGPPKNTSHQESKEAQDPPETLSLSLKIEGMWCPACAWVIESALSKISGVSDVTCHFSTDRLRCRYRPDRIAPDQIRQTVARLGYPVRDSDSGDAARRILSRELIRLILTALLSANVMMLSWALYAGFFTDLPEDAVWKISFPMVIMAVAVFSYGGGPTLRKAWFGLIHGSPGMETLVGMAAGSAFFYSVYNWLTGSIHLYFDTACMLITLVLLGKALEQQAKSRVRSDLESFFSLQPTKVRMITKNEAKGRYVAIEQLSAGDRFAVEAGEIVPADGRVATGTATLDESTLTGEPRPVKVKPGDTVKSGSRVLDGRVIIMAEKVGEATMLGQMIAIMTKSLEEKEAFKGKTDRLLRWFVPMILMLAAGTGVLNAIAGLSSHESIIRAVTVMVISCPCALGVAIPMARLAGISLAGSRGILVREIDAFERAGEVDHIVFDKTGTLTKGCWQLIRIECLPGYEEATVLAWAAGLEEASDHEIARAIATFAQGKGVAPAIVRHVQHRPEGVLGRLDGKTLRMGKSGFAWGDALPGKNLSENKETTLISKVHLGIDGHPVAIFVFGDTIRSGICPFIKRLKTEFHGIALISGDGEAATQQVAKAVGLTDSQGNLSPIHKAKFIDQLGEKGYRVAMVGDGVNDGAAMARAHLSVAVYRGQALSAEAAHITLMRSDPAQLLDFFSLTKSVNRKVHQNLWCAWIYNLISIPVAMMGFLNPLLAALAMVLSSLTVIGNTLLLVRRK